MGHSEELCCTRICNGTIAFLIYITGLPKITFNTDYNNNTTIVLSADVTSEICQ
jgi:hypothetical protein